MASLADAARLAPPSTNRVHVTCGENALSLQAVGKPGSKLLTAKDHILIMIDFRSQMSFATHSIDAVTLRNNAALAIVQAGAQPKTSLQYLLELQRDWARAGTYELTTRGTLVAMSRRLITASLGAIDP